ncbi:hypothetical protein QR680_011918 [Steinernema hermaphroditum]|uniref:Uncharacterized protein n=1 Tax=Steinernema hermaphroditum TaxID=289476 RepID=A0AA39LZU4_9BILA|nr:hypothetical protein QR680_011918 [Steinernema hermaphroditum]
MVAANLTNYTAKFSHQHRHFEWLSRKSSFFCNLSKHSDIGAHLNGVISPLIKPIPSLTPHNRSHKAT